MTTTTKGEDMNGIPQASAELLFRRVVGECAWFGVMTPEAYEALDRMVDGLVPHDQGLRAWQSATPAERRAQ